jgi:uncharacterized protein YndB with AHSA1/START domain
VGLTILNKRAEQSIGARLYVSAPPEDLYAAVLDVRGFPRWAPGVRRVEIVEGQVGPGMVSEWEVSVLGLRRKVRSVLEEAEPFGYLRWSYDGLVRGWGECEISALGDGATAAFTTELRPEDPALNKLAGIAAVSGAATSHLKRCLARLGQSVSETGGFRVVSSQSSAVDRQFLPG